MIRTRVSTSRSFQSIMNDETLCDDLTTLNQNSSSSILYRTFNVHYISQEYVFKKENSSLSIVQEKPDIEQNKSDLFKNIVHLTPRNIAVTELITSEQRFVDDMKNILKTYITSMLENNIISSSHIDALFLNWPSLTRIHEKLANELINALKIDGEQISVGKILCEFFPELITEYEVYFRFHPRAMKCFHEQLHISSKFRDFMQKTKEQTSGIGTMGDANILTLPLQRISKYPVLIDQIIKNTSNNCNDSIQLNNALKKANELRETINNTIEEETNRVKFEWLQNHMDCSKINETIIFNSLTHYGEQRKLIHYNHMKFQNHRLYAMLFNDFLLLTCIKRPLITKIYQIFHRILFKQQEAMSKQSNIDWFDSSEGNHIYLSIYKKPMMLHEIRNVKLNDNDSKSFQFDYRGRQMIFVTNSVNERVLWLKNLNDAIHICRRERFLNAMLRAPESNFNPSISRTIGKIFIREINAINLPFTSIHKHGNNPYCIIKMNNCQRQITPVLCDTSNNIQWNISFEFFIGDIQHDLIKCSIYNRSKYTIDRLLGSVEIPLKLLIERRISDIEETSSIYSLATNHSSELSLTNWKLRRFYLQNSSNNSQISIKYHIHFNE